MPAEVHTHGLGEVTSVRADDGAKAAELFGSLARGRRCDARAAGMLAVEQLP